MKTLILTATILFSSLLTIASNKGNRASEILHVSGKTLNSNDNACGAVLVSIYADGELEMQFLTRKNGKFEYAFDANTYYDVVFEKEGFASKSVKVNTYTQKLNFEFYEFNFNVEMETTEELGAENVLAANIEFNKKRRKFTYNR